MRVCLTLDSDWAHPEVAAFAMDLLQKRGVPFTYFATRDQDVRPAPGMELALHPDFTSGDPEAELALLRERFPEAVGLRPHRLDMPAHRCGAAVRRAGLRWVSSHYDPQARGLARWNDELPDAPIRWGDNRLFLHGEQPGLDGLPLNEPGLAVFNFHPVHLYLNTSAPEQYEAAKKAYRDPAHLRRCANTSDYGVRDALLAFLDTVNPALLSTISQAIRELAR